MAPEGEGRAGRASGDGVLNDGAGFPASPYGDSSWAPKVPTTWRVAISRRFQDYRGLPAIAIVVNGVVNKNPMPSAHRVRLQAQIARLTERGLTLYTHRTGGSCFCPGARMGASGRRLHDDLDKPCTTTGSLVFFYRSRECFDEMVAGHRAVGIDRVQCDHEDGTASLNSISPTPIRSSPRITLLRQNGGQLDLPQHAMNATSAEAVCAPRRSGAHFSRVAGFAATQRMRFYRQERQSGMGLSSGVSIPAGVLIIAAAFGAVAVPPSIPTKRLVVGRALSCAARGHPLHYATAQQP